ncbi:MAG: hypothetical protein KDK61_09155, partial [Simkania sp.]|nr:hypothetical protein [Simkania sp.]
MGLLDMFKKKSQEMTGSAGSLDDLPPIPQNPFSSDQGDSFSQMDGLPPLPGQSASQTSEPAGSLLMDDPLDSSSSLPEPGL